MSQAQVEKTEGLPWVDLDTASEWPPRTRMVIRWEAGGESVYHLHDHWDFRPGDWNDVAYKFLKLN